VTHRRKKRTFFEKRAKGVRVIVSRIDVGQKTKDVDEERESVVLEDG